MKIIALGILLALVGSARSADHVIEVGDEAGCDHSEIQSAVLEATDLAPDSVEVRVTRGAPLADPPLFIHGGNVELTGGWFACGSSSRAGTSSLIGDGESRVLQVNKRVVGGNEVPALVVVDRLLISGGRSVQGAGIEVRGGSVLVLIGSEVVGNQADLAGGGIAVVEDARLVTVDTRISGNVVRSNIAPPRGGGVFCGDGGRLALQAGTLINNNIAQPDDSGDPSLGGGVHVGSTCSLAMNGEVLTSQNRAVLGGGLYFQSGSTGTLFFQDGAFPVFEDNQISSFGTPGRFPSGGAFYLESDVQLRFDRIRATGNGAVVSGEGSSGGLFALEAGAELRQEISDFAQGLPNDCPGGASCMRFSDNRADAAPLGLMASDTALNLDRVLINGHFAPGAALINVGDSSLVRMTNSIVVDNQVGGVLDSNAPGGVRMEFAFNTFADNPGSEFIVRPFGSNNEIRFANNLIVDELAGGISDDGGNDTFTLEEWFCHVGASPSNRPFDRQILIGDPRFNDPVTLDYRIRSDSPAIDVCPAPVFPGFGEPNRDFDGDRRPFDHAFAADTDFIFDGGADEATHEAEVNTLTVIVSGPGRVFGMDEAIDCPGRCSNQFESTRIAGLNAESGPGFEPVWGGACIGVTGDRCDFTMLADRIVTVDFVVSDFLFVDGFETD